MDKFKVCKFYGCGHCYKRCVKSNGIFSAYVPMVCRYENKTGRQSMKQVECKDYEPYEEEESK